MHKKWKLSRKYITARSFIQLFWDETEPVFLNIFILFPFFTNVLTKSIQSILKGFHLFTDVIWDTNSGVYANMKARNWKI